MNSWFIPRNVCPVCASTRLDEIYRNPFTESPIREYLKSFYSSQGRIDFQFLKGATYTLLECQDCRLVFQQEIPDARLTSILYERWIDPEMALRQYEDRNELTTYAELAEGVMQVIAHFKRKPSSLSFLDFGMGWGKWALMVKAFGCNSYGLDLSSARTDYAQISGVTILSMNNVEEHTFDFINSDWVFEHIPNPLETLMTLREALKPEGIVRISVPTVNGIRRRIRSIEWDAPKGHRKSPNAVAPLEHINCFNRRALMRMVSMAGMHEVQIGIDRRFQLARRMSTARRTVRNFVLPVLPGLRRDHVFLARAGETRGPDN